MLVLMASRNGFIAAMVLIALVAVAVDSTPRWAWPGMIQMVWGLGIATYLLSYLYYKRIV